MPGYDRAPTKDYAGEDELDKGIRRLKWTLFIFNILSALLGVATFSVCIWIRFDLDFSEWVEEIDWYSYWHAMYTVLVAMVFVVLLSGIGIWATLEERRGLLSLFTCGLVFMFFFHLTGAIIITVWGVEESKVLVGELREVFLRLVYRWDTDERASRILKQIQEYVGCCGAKGSEDFIRAHKMVPFECRDLVTGSEYRYGCQQQFAWWLEPWTGFLAGVSVAFMVADVIGLWITKKLTGAIGEYHRHYGG